MVTIAELEEFFKIIRSSQIMGATRCSVLAPTTSDEFIADPDDPDAPSSDNPYGTSFWLMKAEPGSNIENWGQESFSIEDFEPVYNPEGVAWGGEEIY